MSGSGWRRLSSIWETSRRHDRILGFCRGSPDAALALPGGSSSQSVEVALLKARIALADHRPEEAVSGLATIHDPRVWILRAQMAEKAGTGLMRLRRLCPCWTVSRSGRRFERNAFA